MVAALTTISEVLTFTLLSTSLWLTLQVYVRHYGPIPSARRIIKVNSWMYTVVSFTIFLFVITVPESPTGTDTDGIAGKPNHPFGASAAATRYIYHLSKFCEFLDILLVCAAGSPINLHFGFHHLTTPYLTFIRFLPTTGAEHSDSDGWRAFAAANTFHHVLMYAYFGGASILRPILPWTGTLQLVVGIAVDLAVGFWRFRAGDDGIYWLYFASAGLLGVYFVLHVRDLRARRI
ncbi:hypothetical protein BJX66DRAFT_309900 [Aspergillus keveii]|uniref:Very-long-chain 3-oxoacyl-CoA synthase n=1 Tax=Aspergillus keveii TaxID=714993 RepID=A0ABR4FXF2_9EURO